MNILEIFSSSVKLILTLDPLLFEIIILSLKVSFSALIISSFFAIIIGYLLGHMWIILFISPFYATSRISDGKNALFKTHFQKNFLGIFGAGITLSSFLMMTTQLPFPHHVKLKEVLYIQSLSSIYLLPGVFIFIGLYVFIYQLIKRFNLKILIQSYFSIVV